MSLSPQLKEFLSRQYILDMIDNKQWNEFYNTLADFDWNNINDVTDFLVHTCDIDPLPFADDDILEFIIPDHIKFIDYSAFRNCRRLSKVVIPTSVQCIEDEVFHSCNDLEYVNYEGTIEQWNQIYKGYRFWTRSRTFDPMTVKCSDGGIER